MSEEVQTNSTDPAVEEEDKRSSAGDDQEPILDHNYARDAAPENIRQLKAKVRGLVSELRKVVK